MKHFRSLLLGIVGVAACASAALGQPVMESRTPDARPRLVVLTDIGNEPDDAESMVRLLVYSNDLQLEGLVAATSRHLPNGVHPELIEQRIAAYGQALRNLRRHDPRYPSVDHLRRIVRAGSAVYGMSGVGDGRETEASRLIMETVDRSDPRPVWVAVWGGAADLAQALWTVRASRSAEETARFVAKLRVYSISDQDDAGPWARANFPSLFWVANVHAFTNYNLATWMGISAPMPGSDFEPVSPQWLDANIRSRGPLGALYPRPAYIMEGDTPSFLHLIPNGLGVSDRPDWGGWGGRYGQLSAGLGLWTTTGDSVLGIDGQRYLTPQASIWRWRWAYQNDFAARMLWAVTPRFAGANHAPTLRLNGQDGLSPVELDVCPGQPVTLSAAGSSDPDGDALSYRWIWYREASGLFAPSATLSGETGEQITVTIGDSARVDQFTPPSIYRLHIILEVTDHGAPPLTRYRRAILSVAGGGVGEARECAVAPSPPTH